METVGFIGLGNMGSGMSRSIQKAGYPMVVHDIREEATKPLLEEGARLAQSPAEVARLSDVTFTSLPGPEEVEPVAMGPGGILGGVKEGGIYVDLSTSGPNLIRRIEPKFRQKGAWLLDAPVSGGMRGAASRDLVVMVGGDSEIYQRIKPILDAFGDKVMYAGPLGAGSVCKLVHNMIGEEVWQAIAEGMTLGVKAGVEPRALWECVRRGDVGRMSRLHEVLVRTVFHGRFERDSGDLKMVHKDVALATALAREHNVPIPVATLAEQIMVQAINRGWGHKDGSVTFRLQEEAAGVEVRAPGVDPDLAARFITMHPDV